MPYCQLFYHIVWATKFREPLITPEIEPAVHNFIRQKALELEATLFALNGYIDHIHLIAAVPPKIALAKFIGQVKAVASVRVNRSGLSTTPFYWQEEYSVFTFDRARLPSLIAYVHHQKEHHSQSTTVASLEEIPN